MIGERLFRFRYKDAGTLNLVYRLSAWTPALKATIANLLVKEHRLGEAQAEYLSNMLVRWDLEDESGVMVPLSKESMYALPVGFMQELFTAIARDVKALPTS